MRIHTVAISREYGLEGNASLEVMLRAYPFDDAPKPVRRPCVLVVPGGGYCMVSSREAEPVSVQFAAKGYHTAILRYSVHPEAHYPTQLLQLAASVDWLRKHAEEYDIDPKRVFVLGFSAGGHLVGDLAVESHTFRTTFGKDWDCVPTAACLCYPVITEKCAYRNSHENLLASYAPAEKAKLLEKLDLDEAVDAHTVPCFLWTTAQDRAVPPINTLLFATALERAGVPYELHIYPEGDHGISTGAPEICPNAPQFYDKIRTWIPLCESFFARVSEREP